jgi:hypothetical protein
MKLYEFFGNLNIGTDSSKDKGPESSSKEAEKDLGDSVFDFIIDDDELHKKYFLPLLKKYKGKKDLDWKEWMPMVNHGCMKYFEEHEVKKHPKDAFPKTMRIDICKRLIDYYREDILKDSYKLGW